MLGRGLRPSGWPCWLSLLAGVTPGVHPGIYQYFLRRIRISTSNPLVGLCRRNGYHCEFQVGFDGTEDKNTTVVSFPCKYPLGTQLAAEMSAVEQLQMVKRLQTQYSDNAVSCTIYYRKHELGDIKQWLADNFADCVKCCSFLLHSEHGFKQAPYEEITQDKYEELVEKVVPIVDGIIAADDGAENEECLGGACPVK